MKQPFDPENRHEDLVNLVDTMNCGIIGRSVDNSVAYMNDRLLDWLGCEREDLVGKPAEIINPPELHAMVREEMTAAREGDLRARLTVLQRKDGTSFPVVAVPHRLFDSDGEYVGGFVILVDLGTVQTAKSAGYSANTDVRGSLSRIALELQSISMAVDLPTSMPLPLHHPDLAQLSPREMEVLALLVSGDRVPSIATQLHISPHTVRNHLKSIYRKMEVQTQSGLIKRVRSLGAPAPPADEGPGSQE